MPDAGGMATVEAEGVGPIRAAPSGAAAPLRRRVYETVRAQGRMSRADLAKALGVSAGSVTPAAADLLSGGWLREVDDDAAPHGRGRPPVALALEPGAGAVAGLRLSDHEHTGVVIDLAGRPVGYASLRRRADTVAGLVAEARTLVSRLAAAAEMPRASLAALGVGLPGLVERDSGLLRWSPLARDRDADLAAALRAATGLPVTVGNDTDMLTVAELWFGKGRGLSDFAVVSVENGIGMGLVVDHAPYRGARGVGMELGHLCVALDGAACRCGRSGCLEAYVADYAVLRAAGLPEGAGVAAVAARAARGDAAARAALDEASRYLALGLANVVNLFDPRHVILSGAHSRLGSADADALHGAVAAHALAAVPPIEVSAWDDLVWARGAAAMALSDATPGLVG